MKLQLLTMISFILLFVSCTDQDTLFEKLSSSQTNITFKNSLNESPDFNVLKYGYFYNGGGVAAGDFNNDGLTDLYFTGNLNANKLYLNKTEPGSGKITFEDITDKAGVGAAEGWNTGVSVVDINADGWLDLYVCRSAAVDARLRRNLLFINNKNLTFSEKAAEYGLDDPAYSTQATFFDYDRDGDLDCFLLNHSVQEYAGFSRMISDFKKQTNPNYSSKLYRNDRNSGAEGKFVDVSASAGMVSNVLSFGLAVAVSDYNNDGWLDMYVSNDYNENDYLYINQQNGTFREVVRQAMGHTSLYSMGSDAADINNDGRIDLLTLDMLPEGNERIKLTSGDDNYDKYQQLLRAGFHHQTMRNMLQLNVGEEEGSEGRIGQGIGAVEKNPQPLRSQPAVPVFSEIGQLAGLSNTDWSWAGLFADFDNDGWKDVFVTNGYARDYTNMEFLKFTMDEQLKSRQTGKQADPMSIIAQMPSINEPNYIFRNTGKLTFDNKTSDWGFSEPTQSNGAVYADLDNDGDQDLVINTMNAEAMVYENHAEGSPSNHHLTIRLVCQNPAKLIGTRVSVWAGGHMQVQEFMPVRGFQSAMYGPLLFGLGTALKADSIQVRWADGRSQSLQPGATNQLTIPYQPIRDFVPAMKPEPFWQATSDLPVAHQEDVVNDFKIQPLLPYMLSQTGPRFAVADVNGDGLDDVFVGGGRGQGGQVLIQQNGHFIGQPQPALAADRACEDAGAEWVDVDNDHDLDLVVVSAGYELPADDKRLIVRLYTNDGRGRLTKAARFPDVRVSASCMRATDIDHDGDQDLFVGARVVPGRYPEAPVSHLLLNDGKGQFTDVTGQQPALKQLGMVTDVAFADLTQDGNPEMIVALDFGPLRIFSFQKGQLTPVNDVFLAVTGCWNRLLIRDFDNDGKPDIVAANAGLNSQLWAESGHPLTLYGIGNAAGMPLPILAGYERNARGAEPPYPFNARDEMLDQVVLLRKKFTNYRSYATATITDLFSPEELKKAQLLNATSLQTVLFRNELKTGSSAKVEGTFTMHPLPIEAQMAPAYALAAVDVNQDGLLDLIIGGNREYNRVRLGKSDANRGQLFLNQSTGGRQQFVYVPMIKAGLHWDGDVRDLAIIRLAGKTGLLVGATGQPIRTFRLTN